MWLVLAAGRAGADTILFLVAEPGGSVVHGDSYVLPLDDPAAIAHARELIALGPEAAGAPIAVAGIAAGADGINRDHRAAGAPEWSWHVTGFQGFADSTIEILDGWIGNTQGTIGFWTYTVVEELPEPPADLLRLACLAALVVTAGARRHAAPT